MDVNSKNGTATALRVMGVAIIVVGTCGSISLSAQMYDSTFWFWVGTLSSVFTGLLVIGLSEIIAILHESREYLKILSSTVILLTVPSKETPLGISMSILLTLLLNFFEY